MRFGQRLQETYRSLRFSSEELLWAQIWHDTVKDVEWIQSMPGISPGRWAVGYNYLYVMTRILNEMRPHSVLDLGLGISSTLFACYFDYYNYCDGKHTVIERDKEWTAFYQKKHSLSQASEVIHCDYEDLFFGKTAYRGFAGFEEKLSGKKYAVISIDAPVGSLRHSRRDVVQLLPDILEKSFVIIMDDTHRKGERDTICEIEECLHKNGVTFHVGSYSGLTECSVITSIDNQYFCTL